MSNHDTDELTRALRERSEDMTGTHLALEDVKGRARGIRRRRRAASGIAVAAVALAVAVPMGINLDSVDRGQQPPVATRAPSPTTDASGPVTPTPQGPVEIDAAKARRGEDPALLFQTGTTLHRIDGSTVELPAQYTYLLPYGHGVMGFNGTEGEFGTTTIVDGRGETVQGPWDGMSGAISSDGSRLATWLAANGGVDLQLWREGADLDEGWTSNVVALDGTLDIAGFVGPETVAYDLTVIGNKGATQKPYVADWLSGEEPRELKSVIDVRGANDVTGVVSGMSKIDDLKGEYCAAVVKVATDKVEWETCDYRLERFSPDGRYVLGVDPQSDGLGSNGVTMLDADNGEVVAEFTVSGRLAYMQTAVWESKSTALVPVRQGDTWYLLRLRPDGSAEKALDPSHDGGDSSPWQLQITP